MHHTVQVAEDTLRTVSSWQGHDLEAWTAAADCWQVSFAAHVLYADPAQDVFNFQVQQPATTFNLQQHAHAATLLCSQT